MHSRVTTTTELPEDYRIPLIPEFHNLADTTATQKPIRRWVQEANNLLQVTNGLLQFLLDKTKLTDIDKRFILSFLLSLYMKNKDTSNWLKTHPLQKQIYLQKYARAQAKHHKHPHHLFSLHYKQKEQQQIYALFLAISWDDYRNDIATKIAEDLEKLTALLQNYPQEFTRVYPSLLSEIISLQPQITAIKDYAQYMMLYVALEDNLTPRAYLSLLQEYRVSFPHIAGDLIKASPSFHFQDYVPLDQQTQTHTALLLPALPLSIPSILPADSLPSSSAFAKMRVTEEILVNTTLEAMMQKDLLLLRILLDDGLGERRQRWDAVRTGILQTLSCLYFQEFYQACVEKKQVLVDTDSMESLQTAMEPTLQWYLALLKQAIRQYLDTSLGLETYLQVQTSLLKKALYKANKESLTDYPKILAQTQQQCALQETTLRTLRKEQEALKALIASAEEEKIALFALWLPTAFTQKTYVYLAKLPLDNPEIQEALRDARIAPSKPYLCLSKANNHVTTQEKDTLFHIILSIAKKDIHYSFLEVVHLFLDRRANLWKCNNKYAPPKTVADVDTLHAALSRTSFTSLMALALQEDAPYSEKAPSLLRTNPHWRPIIHACEDLKTELEALIPTAQRPETRLHCKQAYNELFWLAPTMDFLVLLNKTEEICTALKKEIYWFNPRSSLIGVVAAIESFAEKIKQHIGSADEQKAILDVKHALLQEKALAVPPWPFPLLTESAQQKEIIFMQSQELQQWQTLYQQTAEGKQAAEERADQAQVQTIRAQQETARVVQERDQATSLKKVLEKQAAQERKRVEEANMRAEEANNNTEKANKKVEKKEKEIGMWKNKAQQYSRETNYAQEETQQYKQKLQESEGQTYVTLQKNVILTQENILLTSQLQEKDIEIAANKQIIDDNKTTTQAQIDQLNKTMQQMQAIIMELYKRGVTPVNAHRFFSSPSEEKNDTTPGPSPF